MRIWLVLLAGCQAWITTDDVDARLDGDADGFLSSALGGPDCDDTDPAIRPGAPDTWYDGIDTDCQGDDDFDQDRDGRRSAAFGGDDCDDTDPTVSDRAPDWRPDCDGDGRPSEQRIRSCAPPSDDVCDGTAPVAWLVDAPLLETDCDDRDAAIPAADDPPYDGIDSDCDGANDYDADGDGFVPNLYLPVAPVGSRGGDCDDARADWSPAAEDIPYDGIDANCDGVNDYDADADGFIAAEHIHRFPRQLPDCDDFRADTHPGAPEVWYDGRDQDCLGGDDFDADGDGIRSPLYLVGEGPADCDDTDPTAFPGNHDAPYDGIDGDCRGDDDYDLDGDGFPGAVRPDIPAMPLDCDDTDPTVNPGAVEDWSDDVDQDCDGNSLDQDGDGAPRDVDCDDTDPRIHPGALEIGYDGIDQDCDGLADDQDLDGDGVPAPADCDDLDPTVLPGAEEIWYDGIDQDCSLSSDFDRDGDGWVLAEDCDDTDASVFPGANEVWYDDLDQDCDGSDDFDRDRDGRPFRAFCVVGRVPMDPRCADADCDDTTPDDEDCYFQRDRDADGYPAPVDCDDADPEVSPLAAEVPYDGIDNDCDGVDLFDVDGDGFEADLPGCVSCDDCDDTDPDVHPAGIDLLAGSAGGPVDRDCDGRVGDDDDRDGDGVDDVVDCAPDDATRWRDEVTVGPGDDLVDAFASLCPTARLVLEPGLHVVDQTLRGSFDDLVISGPGATLAPAVATTQRVLALRPRLDDLALTVRDVELRGAVDAHPADGGCLWVDGGAGRTDVCLDDVAFASCRSEERGGALFARDANVFLRDATFSRNEADRGGAVYVEGTLTGRDVRFVGNQAGAGGAIDLVGPATLDLAHGVFTANAALLQGGAVRVGPGVDTLTLADLAFTQNTAPDGSALHGTGLRPSATAPLTPTCQLPATTTRPSGDLRFDGDWGAIGLAAATDPENAIVTLLDHSLDLDGLWVSHAVSQVGVLLQPSDPGLRVRDVRVVQSGVRRALVVRGPTPDSPARGGTVEKLLVQHTRLLEFVFPTIQPRWSGEEAAVMVFGPDHDAPTGVPRPVISGFTVTANRTCVQVQTDGDVHLEHGVLGQPEDPADWGAGFTPCPHPALRAPAAVEGPTMTDVHLTHGSELLLGSSVTDCDYFGLGLDIGCTSHPDDPYRGGYQSGALGRLRPDSGVELLGDAPGYWNAP